MSLFRKEALEYQCVRLSGAVSLRVDRRLLHASIAFLVLSIVFIAWFRQMTILTSNARQCEVNPDGRSVTLSSPVKKTVGNQLLRIDITLAGSRYTVAPDKLQPSGVVVNPGGTAKPGAACSAIAYESLSPAEIAVAKLLRRQ